MKMDRAEKNRLSREVRMQTEALKRIARWKGYALCFSAAGAAVFYGGVRGSALHPLLIVLGIGAAVAGLVGAMVFNLGLKNGRRNVRAILNALEEGCTEHEMEIDLPGC